MQLDHVGIIHGDEVPAGKFYHEVLGLEKIKDSVVGVELARRLFSIESEIKMVVYGNDSFKIEIFLVKGFTAPPRGIAHFCLKLDKVDELLERARKAGVEVVSAHRGERTVHFLKDFSGNRIEVISR